MKKRLSQNARDSLITAIAVAIAFAICAFLRMLSDAEISIPLIFVLTVLIVSRLTEGYFYGIFTSIAAVFGVNYVFTYPYFAFNFTISGYPITFLSMFVVSIITSALTTQVKQQEKLRLESEKEKLYANFLRAISHDLRTPLTSIVGSASVILENERSFTSEQRRMLLLEILDEATRLIQMVENLLSVTRMRGETAIRKTHELAEELIGEVSRKFKKRYPNTPLRISIPGEALFIPMDILLIEQVLMNLLENAAVHGEGLTRVELSVAVRGDTALFSVENDGKGVDPDIMEHILEDGCFIADQKGKPAGKRNMGIGLSLCASIVKAHGGTVSAENSACGGDDYVTKPFNSSELLARIRSAIRRAGRRGDDRTSQTGRYRIDDLTIDYDKHRVLIAGENVRLTRNEFKIVALLGRNAGKVLTHAYILKEIWGASLMGDNRILRVNMANIRCKIEENPAEPKYIFTEIGVGYWIRDAE